ncbi:MAG: hypothetical protein QOF61_2554 [Acidobacteriota bacterium]|jgi:VWFA-related protein|nr:hypothetical protein [Acidobacteriota bacterium]
MRGHALIRGCVVLSLIVLLAAGLTRAQPKATNAAPQARVSRADVWFAVEGKSGQCVASLRPEDVRVLEDGVAQQITSFVARRDAPRSIAIAIDTSASQSYLLPAVKRVAQALVALLPRPQTDRVAVVSFSSETVLEQDFTNDAATAQKSIVKLASVDPNVAAAASILIGKPSPLGATSMYDALWVIGNEVFASAPADSRRVLILLTDGQDTSSATKKRDSARRLLESNVVVYAIGVGDEENFAGVDRDALKDLAERTGGRAYFPQKDPEVREVFTEIGQSLGCQNFLTYTPANPDAAKTFRKLKIEIVNPELRKQGLRVSHQEAFVPAHTPATPRGK